MNKDKAPKAPKIKSAPSHAKHGRVGGIFWIRGRNKARGSFTNITTGALSTKERGYLMGGRTLNIDLQGDVGYGVSRGATHLVHRKVWTIVDGVRAIVIESIPLGNGVREVTS